MALWSVSTRSGTRGARGSDLVLIGPPVASLDEARSRPRVIGARAVRVLIAEGQPVVRAGLRALLGGERDIAVVGEAGNGGEAVALAGRVRPDVVLLDTEIAGHGAEEPARIVGDLDQAGVRVLMLASREDDESLFVALRAGASGFLVKNTEAVDLVEAIRVVASGEALLSPGATARLIAEFTAQPQPQLPTEEQLEKLTAREQEVMTLVAIGLSNDEIAERFVISRATVKTHVSRILSKLDVRDRAQLVAVAYQSGFVRPGHGHVLATAAPARAARVAA